MVELGSYIDKLESNENLIELNILDELANDIQNTLVHISDWKQYQRNLVKGSHLRVANFKLDVKSQDV